ncbi:MAG: glycosyltransferase, partial [Actinomycetota bacterium]|nr:glycosyltransferase [Actinomycetota bacterium]
MASLRILLVSSLYPGPADPDFGVFVRRIADELERQGHVVARVVSDRRSGLPSKHLRLAARALATARAFRPDVVYAHYLVPAGVVGAIAARAAGAGLVVTAHGRDVRNVGELPGVAPLTRLTVARCQAVVAVSDFLRRELVARVPEASGKVEVVASGVDLERFRGRDAEAARAKLGWSGEPPFFVSVGTLDERKNVLRLAEAFARFGRGTLAFVGDGRLRPALEGRERIRLVGRVPHEQVADWIAASDVVCLPSLVEPLGQALLEAMASERSVVATRVGGPPEFVTPETGVLVDPASVESIEEGLRAAAALPRPNAAARAAARRYDVRVEARRVGEVLE